MAAESVEAIHMFGVDGALGERPTLYGADGTAVELRDTFAPFLEAVDGAVTSNDPSRAACIFNLVDGRVDGYAVEAVAQTSACTSCTARFGSRPTTTTSGATRRSLRSFRSASHFSIESTTRAA